MNRFLTAFVVASSIAAGTVRGDPPNEARSFPELYEARRIAWQMASMVVEKLNPGDPAIFPGLHAWLEDYRKVAKDIDVKAPPEKWRTIDADSLVTRNPNFWRAYYEIAPGDPGLLLVHAGLLLSGGEASRASYLVVVAGQRPGIPKYFQPTLESILAHGQRVSQKSNEMVREGIKLHDQRDYLGALNKYKEVLDIWPQNGFAHYEVGYSLRQQKAIAARGQPLPQKTVIVNDGKKTPVDVAAAFAKSRRHDPFQLNAYQGDDQEVIRGLFALSKKGMPAWKKIIENRKGQVDDEVLVQFAGACQEANIHELALAARQVLVARRKNYSPDDHPFIGASLRKLVPGDQAEATLKRLAGEKVELRQIVAPEKDVP